VILTGREIERCVGLGEISIDPFDAKHCNPNSYNFHLGDKLLVYQGANEGCVDPSWHLETRKANPTEEITIPPEGVVLQPGKLYLGHTVESIGSTKYAPVMAARSSLGRLGLFIFLNSGLGDIGFVGQWTLEFTVVHPLKLRVGDRVGQMMFYAAQGEIVQYSGKYQNAKGPQASLIYKDEPSSSIASRPKRIKRLLLDAGGVLVSEGSVVEKLCAEVAAASIGLENEDGPLTVRHFWDQSVRRDLWSGRISIAQAVAKINRQFKTKVKWAPHDLSPLPWAERALRLCPQTAVLSNHRSEWLLPSFARFGWKLPTFVSDTLGYVKPDSAIYEKCARLWGVSDLSEVLFVDNKQANVDEAIAMGMQGLFADARGKWVDKAEALLNSALSPRQRSQPSAAKVCIDGCSECLDHGQAVNPSGCGRRL